MIKLISRNWLPKLGSLALAILLWLFVSNSSNAEASREFTVPVIYNGLESDQIVRGAPPSVLVKVLGRRNQLNSLEPGNFSAFIDFRDTEGEYEKDVEVLLPPSVDRVLSITPQTAIGTVESIATKTVPVEASLIGELSEDKRAIIDLPILEANVLGFSSSLEQVTKVIATVASSEGSATVSLFAADANNHPIKDTTLTVAPATVSVAVSYEEIVHKKQLALNVQEPQFEGVDPQSIGLSSLSLSQDTIEVVGPNSLLKDLDEVPASVESITQDMTSGEYTLKVTPILPEGLTATETVTMSVTLQLLPNEQLDEQFNNGETDDSARSPLWRSRTTQESTSRNFLRQ